MKARQLPRTIATSSSVPPGYVRMPWPVNNIRLRHNTSAGTKAEVPKVHFQWSITSPHISSRSAIAAGPCPLSMTMVIPLLRGGCVRPVNRPSTTCAQAFSGILDLLLQLAQRSLDHSEVCAPRYHHDG